MAKEKITLTLAEAVKGIGAAGERVTLELTPADVHDASEMPTYLAGYKPFPFRADEASPIVPVNNDTDKYRTFNADDAFKHVVVKGDASARVPEVSPKSGTETYKVVSRFIGSFIPDATRYQDVAYDPVMAAGRRCKWAIDLDREIDVFSTLLGTIGNWDTTVRTTLGAGRNWNGGASSTPMKDLQDQIEKSWAPVTDIWMNTRVAHAFIRHNDVKDHMRQFLGDAAPGAATTSVYKSQRQNVDFEIPGLPPIHVTAAKVKDDTGAIDYVFPNCVVLVSKPVGVPMDGEEIATSYTFRRRGPSGTGFESREFFVDDRGELGGTMLVASCADIAVMAGAKVGGYITGVYA